ATATTDTANRNLTIQAAMTFTVNVGTVTTNPDGVNGRPYGTPLGANDLIYTAAGGLGVFVFTPPVPATLPTPVACVTAATTVTCNSGAANIAEAGPFPAAFPYSLSVADTANLTTPAANITLNPTLTVNGALAITTLSPLPSATVTVVYSQMLAASGGLPGLTWSTPTFPAAAGTACGGFTLSAAGLADGTPDAAAPPTTCTFTANVDDTANATTPDSAASATTGTAALDIPVAPVGSPLMTNNVLINGLAGVFYSQSFAATGGAPPFTWVAPGAVSAPCPVPPGTLPTGTTLGAASGVLDGTATPAGTFTFDICVHDGVGFNSQRFTVVINPSNVLVTNSASDNVTAIETVGRTVVGTTAVGSTPRAVAIAPGGTRAYVTNQNTDNVSVIDTLTNAVVATVAILTNSLGIAVTPDGTRAYATGFPSDDVVEIDTATNTVVATITLPVAATGPRGIAVRPDGARAYVANSTSNNVSVIDIDPASGTFRSVLTTIAVGTTPGGLGVTPDGRFVYVGNSGSNNVTVIDTATNAQIPVGSPIAVGTTPGGVAVSPDGRSVFVSNQGSNNVSIIDPSTNTVTATVNGVNFTGPNGLVVTPDGLFGYVANAISPAGTVSVIDNDPANVATFQTVIDTVTVGDTPDSELGVAAIPNPVLHITTTALLDANATVPALYQDAVVAIGGTGTLTWSETTAPLPVLGVAATPCEGLTLDVATGLISGTPVNVGICGPLDITVTDSATVPQSVTVVGLTITVN
ncbi:MAG: beta-propeller fold lactonase family protein, partial [Terriglobia bacterium]